MIYIEDNFLSLDDFEDINNSINSCKFNPVDVGDSFFYVQESNEKINNYVINKLEKFEGRRLTNILSFFRVATDKLDTSWRIHSDLIVNGQKPDRALVLYLLKKELTLMELLFGIMFITEKNFLIIALMKSMII